MTHLSLPRNLSLDHLEEIVHTMKHLQQLDVFVNGAHMESRLLATAAGVKKLTISFDDEVDNLGSLKTLLEGIKQQGDSFPSVINIYVPRSYYAAKNQLFQFWSTWSPKLPSFEVGLYEIRRVPINLYPSIPLMKFQFGPAARPPLIKLTDHGILGLKPDKFHFTEYDHYGKVRHSITVQCFVIYTVKEQHFNCISNLYSVSNVDFYGMNIYPGQLEQLAIACPNLERINLLDNTNCLQSLKGLQALVNKCQNLQGINLVGIQTVESHLLLWKILSSVKKLTHLAIGLSMLTDHGNCHDVDQQKLIGLLKSCGNLKALEVTGARYVVDTKDFLLSHFPSLVYVRLETKCIGLLEYTITNCHQLKYLYYDNWITLHHISLSSNSCHLQQLHMNNIDLSATSVHALSAHGGLEQVILYDVRITTSAITTLISNSPNLILLDILQLVDDINLKDCKDTMSKTFSNHKLFTVGDFFIHENHCYEYIHHYEYIHYNTNLNSLW